MCTAGSTRTENSEPVATSRDDWEKSLLASGHCTSGKPVGLSQDSMADPGARRRGRAAGEHQLVHEWKTPVSIQLSSFRASWSSCLLVEASWETVRLVHLRG